MTVTVGQTVKTATGANTKTLSFTPTAVGNCIVLSALAANTSSIVPTGISDSHGAITWTAVPNGSWYRGTSPPSGNGRMCWIGVVGTGGAVATTITITYSASVTSVNCEICALELHSSVAAVWSVVGNAVTLQVTTSSTTVTMPTVPTTANDQIYYGYGNVTNQAITTGQTSGYTAFSTTTNGNLVLYNLDVTTTGNQSPIGKQNTAGASAMIAFIITTVPPPQTVAMGVATQVVTVANPFARAKTVAFGVANQVTTNAFQLATNKTYPLGLAASTATAAFALTLSKAGLVLMGVAGPVVTTAFAFARNKLFGLGVATQVVTSAKPLALLKLHLLGVATTVATTAFPFKLAKVRTLGVASVATAAFPMASSKTISLGVATVTTTAYPVLVKSPNHVILGVATVATTAYPIGLVKVVPVWKMIKWFVARGQSDKWSEKQELPK